MMQKEHVSRDCGWGTGSINTSKTKSYPITVKEHIEITSWMSYHQFTLGIFSPHLQIQCGKMRGGGEISSRITNPYPLCMVLQAIFSPQWTM